MTSPRPLLLFRITLATVVLAMLAVTRFGTRWPSIYVMTGPSMEPTVAPREYFLAWDPPGRVARGDLVIFRFVDADGEYDVLRRVAGLPGDTVAMTDGAVLVNRRRSPWPYQVLRPAASRSPYAIGGELYTWGPWVVPRDSLLLLSDTRDMIGWPDSRFIGFVGADAIVARATRTLRGRRLR